MTTSYIDIITAAANLPEIEVHNIQCSWPSSSIVEMTFAGSTLRLRARADGVEINEDGLEEVVEAQEVLPTVLGWIEATADN